MASNAPTECGICDNIYSAEEHCPRILPCSHCLCSKCIDQLINTNNKCCPFCHQNFEAKSSRDVLINKALLDLLSYFLKSKGPPKPPDGGQVNQLAKMVTEFREENKETSKKNLEEFQIATSRIKKAIKTNSDLREDLLKTNKILDEQILNKIQEIKTKNGKHIKYLEDENGRLNGLLDGIPTREKRITKVDAELKEAASDFTVAAPIMGKAEETNNKMKEYLKDLKNFLTKEEKNLLGIGKAAKKTHNKISLLQGVMTSSDDEDEEEEDFDLITPGMAGLAIHVDPEEVTVDALRRLSDQLRAQIQDGSIMAVQDIEGRRRYSRISFMADGNLCLHHLKEEMEPLPSNVRLIKCKDAGRPAWLALFQPHPGCRDAHLAAPPLTPLAAGYGTLGGTSDASPTDEFDDVMSLVNISCRRTFLELGIEGRSLGRLLICLSHDIDNKFALNYFLLCSGQMGQSYAHSNILMVGSKGHDRYECVRMGDYEEKVGEGGKAVVEGVDWGKEWDREMYKRPQEKGAVRGCWATEAKASQFYIFTRDNPSNLLGGFIGIVEEGLNFLIEAISKHPNKQDINVFDCGVLLTR